MSTFLAPTSMSTLTWAFRAPRLVRSVGIRAPCRWSGPRIQSLSMSISTSSSMPPVHTQTESKSKRMSDFIQTTICLLLFGHGIYSLHKAVKERNEVRRETGRIIALLDCYRADRAYCDNLVPFGSYACAMGYMREVLWLYYVGVVGLSAMDVDRLFKSMTDEGKLSDRITPDNVNKARIWDLCEGLRRELSDMSAKKTDVDEASVYALAEIFNRYAMKFLQEAVALSEVRLRVVTRACLASVRAEEDAQELPAGDWRSLE